MKASFCITVLFAAGLIACSKQPSSFGTDSSWDTGDAVVFSVSGLETKAGALESLPSFGVACFTGELGREARLQWRSVYMNEGDGLYVASTHDRFWPQKGDPGYRFVASNAEMEFSSTGASVVADGSLDVVTAVNQSPSPRSENSLSFRHIYARIGKVTVAEVGMHPLTEVSITIVPRTGGVFDLVKGEGHVDGTGWSSLKSGSETELTSGMAGTKENDLFLVPGRYILSARWSVRKPNRIASFEKKREVDLEAGTISNILTSFGSDGEDIFVSVSLRDWDVKEQTAQFGPEDGE